MTTDRRDTVQGMTDWLESELRQVKSQLGELGEQIEEDRAQLWSLNDRVGETESGSISMAAQLSLLTTQAEELRVLRERLERLQGVLGRDQEQLESLARQLRNEMQAERDERNELGRRVEAADAATNSVREKLTSAEESGRRLQEEMSVVHQRLEQGDLNQSAVDARIAANAEAARRLQGEARTAQGNVERAERSLQEMGERVEGMQQIMRRMKEVADRWEEKEEQFEALRTRTEDLRRIADEASSNLAAATREREAIDERLNEMERGLERLRVRDAQRDRDVQDLQAASQGNREAINEESERFITLQEKIRRRQISDLEQEIRELKGFGNTTPPNA